MKHMLADLQPRTDTRFRELLGDQAWAQLPAAIRKRFGKRLTGGSSVTYQGVVAEMRMSRVGWCLAQLCRLVGGPLPYERDTAGQPAVVVVTEDAQSDGQFWIRQYGRPQGFPQVVHSSKRFSGPTGLEEYVGCGVGMALIVEAADDALYFKSAGYFFQLGARKLRLPKWLSPGDLVIGHHDLGAHTFLFSLNLSHPLLGEMIVQDCVFQDMKEETYA